MHAYEDEEMVTKIPRRIVVDHITRLSATSTRTAVEHIMNRLGANRQPMDLPVTDDDFAALAEAPVRNVKARAERLITHLKSRSPTSAKWLKLSADDLRDVARLSKIGHVIDVSRDHIDRNFAHLHNLTPWLREASTAAMMSARASSGSGAGIRIPPLLLVGPPGTGKTTWATAVASKMCLQSIVVGAASRGLFALAGVESGWSTARSGALISRIIATGCGNPVVVVDEIDKASGGGATARGAHVGGMSDGLIEMIEPATARAWQCPHLGVRFDLSRVSWILTANDLSRVPEPLRDRCRVVYVASPTRDEAAVVARRRAQDRLDEDFAEQIGETVRAAYDARTFSLRAIDRLIDAAVGAADTPLLH